MADLATSVVTERAAILAETLEPFVADLRLVDPGDIIAYIRAAQWANIADLVHSSAELWFREDALLFGCSGDFALDWTSAPTVALDMEFRCDAVSVFFTLILERATATVALRHVWFAAAPADAVAGTRRMRRALAAVKRS